MTDELADLILALLKQGEGFDYGAPPEVRAHFRWCEGVVVVDADSHEVIDYVTITANMQCPHLNDLYGFEYGDFNTVACLLAAHQQHDQDDNHDKKD